MPIVEDRVMLFWWFCVSHLWGLIVARMIGYISIWKVWAYKKVCVQRTKSIRKKKMIRSGLGVGIAIINYSNIEVSWSKISVCVCWWKLPDIDWAVLCWLCFSSAIASNIHLNCNFHHCGPSNTIHPEIPSGNIHHSYSKNETCICSHEKLS